MICDIKDISPNPSCKKSALQPPPPPRQKNGLTMCAIIRYQETVSTLSSTQN